jgi:hypothetical protein
MYCALNLFVLLTGGDITLEQLDKKLDEHFLKQLAPINKALKLIITELLDPWERIHSETESVVEAAEQRNLDLVSDFYEMPKTAMCMVLGKATNCQIKCAHIWPRCALGRGLEAFDLNDTDVDNPRNFLRLHRDIERAFDRKRLVFVPEALGVDGEVLLKVVILDPRLHSEDLTFNDTTVQFSTVHNQLFSYTFVSSKMPYTRLLANHALQATNKAKSLGWIPKNDPDIDIARSKAVDMARRALGEESLSMKAF